MKKIYLILMMLFLFGLTIMAQSNGNSRYLKPTNYAKKVIIKVGDKSRSYYALSADKPSIINIQGPGKLRVMSRGQFKPGGENEIDYTINYVIDGGAKNVIEIRSVQTSDQATYADKGIGIPGQLKDFEIDLGRGYHNIEFKHDHHKVPIAVRYKFTPAKVKKQEWIAFCPKRPSEPVDLISREETIAYYRFSSEKTLKVEVNGPTELRVLTRLENHYQMKGRINYRVQVKENDVIRNTYQLSSRRSEIAIYKDNNELIPGKASEFVIDVPKGRHTYEIVPLDKDKNTLLGRFLLPKKDVKLVN
jgi:hypothetical protein